MLISPVECVEKSDEPDYRILDVGRIYYYKDRVPKQGSSDLHFYGAYL